MENYLKIQQRLGSLSLYRDIDRGLFIVEPKGIINPSLIKRDLEEATLFGNEYKKGWTYLVNTTHVLFPNPLNLLFLYRIKKLPYLKEYIIYAPSVVVRLLSSITSFIIQPDRVLKTKEEFAQFLESYSEENISSD